MTDEQRANAAADKADRIKLDTLALAEAAFTAGFKACESGFNYHYAYREFRRILENRA